MKDQCNSLKNIVMIGTGGTITGTGEKGKTIHYKSAQMGLDKLVSDSPEINTLANIEIKELFKVDSCDLKINHWINLTDFINNMSEHEDVDGFVVTHGTDTLEETAFFLNLTVKTQKPVVVTGSMRPATSLSADGPFNLFQAVALARSEQAVGKGVLVNFSDAIYGARDVQKINTYRTSAFDHRGSGCLGFVRDDQIHFYNSSTKPHTINSEFKLKSISSMPKVGIAYFYVGAGVDILDYFYQNSEGVIVAGAGCGGCSTEWNDKIKELTGKGFPVVRSSRVSNGLVTCEQDPKNKMSEIYADTLSPQKSSILLSLALTKTHNVDEIAKMFQVY